MFKVLISFLKTALDISETPPPFTGPEMRCTADCLLFSNACQNVAKLHPVYHVMTVKFATVPRVPRALPERQLMMLPEIRL